MHTWMRMAHDHVRAHAHVVHGHMCMRTRHEVIERLAAQRREDLGRRRRLVHPRVRLVVELAREEPAVLGGELLRLDDHAGALVRGVCQHHLGAEEAHQLAPLDRKGLRHDAHERVALGRAHGRQSDAGVPRGGLHHRLPRLQLARPLRPLDHRQREPILDRAARIERFGLDVDVDAGGCHALQFNQRRVANRRAYRVVLLRCRRRSEAGADGVEHWATLGRPLATPTWR